MTNKIQLPTAGLLLISDRRLLLAFSRNKKAWYLPGGKCDAGESPVAALVREIEEELNTKLIPECLQFYTHISAPAFGEDKHIIMEQDCFIYRLPTMPVAGSEIEAVQFFNCSSYAVEPRPVIGVIMVMQQLKNGGWID